MARAQTVTINYTNPEIYYVSSSSPRIDYVVDPTGAEFVWRNKMTFDLPAYSFDSADTVTVTAIDAQGAWTHPISGNFLELKLHASGGLTSDENGTINGFNAQGTMTTPFLTAGVYGAYQSAAGTATHETVDMVLASPAGPSVTTSGASLNAVGSFQLEMDFDVHVVYEVQPPLIIDEYHLWWAKQLEYTVSFVPDTQVTGGGSTGNWSNSSIWTGGVPNGPCDVAYLGNGTAPRTLALDTAVTLGKLIFDSDTGYTINGPNTLTFECDGFTLASVLRGSHVINTAVVAADDLQFNVASSSSLVLNGPLSTSSARVLSKYGGGSLTIAGAQSYATGTVFGVGEGTLNLNSDAGAGGASLNLSVGPATANLNTTQRLASVNAFGGAHVTIAAGRDKVLATKSVSVDSASQIDIKDNGIIIDYTSTSPLSDVREAIASAYDNGSWTGNGITSSSAAAARTSSQKTGIGYGEASVVGRTDLFGESVDSTAVVVKYTYYGDANLDGVVDTVDFGILGSNWEAVGVGWQEGDSNYDGVVDSVDYNLMAANFGQSGLTGASLPELNALLPEPTAAAAAVLGCLGLARRRRNHGQHR
jgi:hypothetical protein